MHEQDGSDDTFNKNSLAVWSNEGKVSDRPPIGQGEFRTPLHKLTIKRRRKEGVRDGETLLGVIKLVLFREVKVGD